MRTTSIPLDSELYPLCYEHIKNAGGEWIDIDDLCKAIRRDRASIAKTVLNMTKSKNYPNIEKVTKRKSGKCVFGRNKATYDIKYRYTGE